MEDRIVKKYDIALTGQQKWCTILADSLRRHAGLDAAIATFERPNTALSPTSWMRIARSRSVLRVGFRPRSASARGRVFDAIFGLVTSLGGARVAYYWIGTDVAQTVADVEAGRLDARNDRSIQRAGHIAGSASLAAELAEIGINARVAYFPFMLELPDTTLAPMPEQFTVLSYVPDARPAFYSGPALLEVARALPDVQFAIMGGSGTWTEEVPDNVRFLGWVDDTPAAFRAVSCVVRDVEHDAIGATVLEAMLYGRPVIYSGNLEHAIHVDYGDTGELTAAIARLRDEHNAGTLAPTEAAAQWSREFSDPKARTEKIAEFLREIMPTRSHRVHDAVARVCSFVGALAIVVLLSPVLLVIALAVLLAMGRPVLFVQRRPGLHGEPIAVHKFRTMRNLGPELSDEHAVSTDAERITRLGHFLRKTSLDELPQFFDVLRGDMNLVGPRPLLMEYLDRYSAYHARRHEVRPGITGWAQVNGRNARSWDDRLDMDVWYVDHRSLWLDLRVLATTLPVAFSGKGVSSEGAATAVPYRGSGNAKS